MTALRMPRLRPVAKADDDDHEKEIERINGLAGKLERRIQAAFLDAIRKLADKLDLVRIAGLLTQGRTVEAIATVDAQLIADGLAPLASAITDATIAAGRSAATAPDLAGIEARFGTVNPQTIAHLQSYEFDKIREMTVDALQSVREAVQTGVREGRNPIDVARDVKGFIGLTQQQTQAVLNFRRALENGQRDALDRALRDKRFDPTVVRAINGQKPLSKEQIDTMVARYQARYLKYRAETIARTEAITAVNAGNRLAWKQAVADGKMQASSVVRYWVDTHDTRTRHAHRMIPITNAKGVGLDQPFVSELGPILYPGDPNATAANRIRCRCAQIIRFRPTIAAAT